MAYTIPAGAILEMTIIGTLFGQKIYTVRHYIRDPLDSGTIPDGGQALKDIVDYWGATLDELPEQLSNYQTSDMKLDFIQGQWIFPTRYAYYRIIHPIGEGDLTPPTVPQNLAGVLTLQSDAAGRTGRGDMHIAGLDLDSISAGELTPAAQSHLSNIGSAAAKSIQASGLGDPKFYPIVYHRAAPASSNIITHYTPQVEVRTMSRRTLGRGI